jgi:hypothetical protein
LIDMSGEAVGQVDDLNDMLDWGRVLQLIGLGWYN